MPDIPTMFPSSTAAKEHFMPAFFSCGECPPVFVPYNQLVVRVGIDLPDIGMSQLHLVNGDVCTKCIYRSFKISNFHWFSVLFSHFLS